MSIVFFFIKDNQHWLLLQIDLVNYTINMCDNMSNIRHNIKVRENVASYFMMIPNLLHHINFFEQRLDIKDKYWRLYNCANQMLGATKQWVKGIDFLD